MGRAITARRRLARVLLVRIVQRSIMNPLMRLLVVGINPFGLAILETR
jgi:hypothetical protein